MYKITFYSLSKDRSLYYLDGEDLVFDDSAKALKIARQKCLILSYQRDCKVYYLFNTIDL